MSERVEIEEAEVLAVTPDAVLVMNHDVNEEAWLPRSLIEHGDKYEEGDTDSLQVARFKMEELGWV